MDKKENIIIKWLHNDKNFIIKWFFYMGVAAVAICIILYCMDDTICSKMILKKLSAKENGFSIYDAYYTQCSLTFIVLSLISFLANNTNKILWDDTVHYSLVHPAFIGFVPLSAYLISDLCITTFLLLKGTMSQIFLTLTISVGVLVVISYRIIGAFFVSGSIKEKLIQDYAEIKDNERRGLEYLKNKDSIIIKEIDKKIEIYKKKERDISSLERQKGDILKNERNYVGERQKKIHEQLYESTLQEIDNREYELVKENIDFIISNCEDELGGGDLKDRLKMIIEYSISNSIGLFYEIMMNNKGNKVIREAARNSWEIIFRNRSTPAYIKVDYLHEEFPLAEGNETPDICKLLLETVNDDKNFEGREFAEKVVKAEYFYAKQVQEKEKPVDILYESYHKRDLESFEIILEYLENEREKMKTWITDTGYSYWEEVDEIEDKLSKEQYRYVSDVPMYFIGMEIPLCYDPLMNYFNNNEMTIMRKILIEESIKKDFINRDGFEKIFSCMWGILSEICIDEKWLSNPEKFWDDLDNIRKRIDVDNIYND